VFGERHLAPSPAGARVSACSAVAFAQTLQSANTEVLMQARSKSSEAAMVRYHKILIRSAIVVAIAAATLLPLIR
jgi:hypothetical protein